MKVPFGLKEGRMWAPDEVPTGLVCGCTCPGCGGALVAKNSEGNQHISHFAHHNTSDCATGAETALHLAAKQLIDERRQLFFPDLVATSLFRHRHLPETLHEYTRISQGSVRALADVVLEQSLGPIRPDLRVVDAEGNPVLVEVAVTHFVDEPKRAKAELLGLPIVEFDLSELPRFDFASLEAVLFQYTDSARWVHHPLIEAERDRQRQAFEAGLNDPTSKVGQLLAEGRDIERAEAAEEQDRRRIIAESAAKNRAAERRVATFLAMKGPERSNTIHASIGLAPAYLPWFLRTKRAEVAGVGRIWQAAVYASLIRTAWRRRAFVLSIADVQQWLLPRFPASQGYPDISTEVICRWLNLLAAANILAALPAAGRYAVVVGPRPDALLCLETLAKQPVQLFWNGANWPSASEASAAAQAFTVGYGTAEIWERVSGLLPKVGADATVSSIVHYYETEFRRLRVPQQQLHGRLRQFLVAAGFVSSRRFVFP